MVKDTIFEVTVDCYAGYRGEETPKRFWIGEKEIVGIDIADRWLAPDHRYFKINASDGNVYVLRHDVVRQVWELVLYKSTGA
jgi:hypothetical protein